LPIVDLQRRIELANNYSELANTANRANKGKTIVTQKCIPTTAAAAKYAATTITTAAGAGAVLFF
jgi:hypothetical protein